MNYVRFLVCLTHQQNQMTKKSIFCLFRWTFCFKRGVKLPKKEQKKNKTNLIVNSDVYAYTHAHHKTLDLHI